MLSSCFELALNPNELPPPEIKSPQVSFSALNDPANGKSQIRVVGNCGDYSALKFEYGILGQEKITSEPLPCRSDKTIEVTLPIPFITINVETAVTLNLDIRVRGLDPNKSIQEAQSDPQGWPVMISTLFEFVVPDISPPKISITQKPSLYTGLRNADFEISATDNHSIAQLLCSLDSADTENLKPCDCLQSDSGDCRKPIPSGAAAKALFKLAFPGTSKLESHKLQVIAVDEAGNRSAPVSYSWQIVAGTPTCSIAPTPTVSAASSRAFYVTCDDGGYIPIVPESVSCDVTYNDFLWWNIGRKKIQNCPFRSSRSTDTTPKSIDLTDIPPGIHTIEVVAKNAEGISTEPAKFTFIRDAEAPKLMGTCPTWTILSSYIDLKSTLNLKCSDGNQNLVGECKIRCWTPSLRDTCTMSLTTEGIVQVSARAEDSSGNVSPYLNCNFFVDLKDPTTPVFTQKPAANSSSSSATFTWQASSDGAGSGIDGYRCWLDGWYIDCLSGGPNALQKTFTNLKDGWHSFRLLAIDKAGRESLPVTYTWNIGNETPWCMVKVDGMNMWGGPDFYNSLTQTTYLIKNEIPIKYECTLTSGGAVEAFCDLDATGDATTPCGSASGIKSVLIGADGPHSFTVTARPLGRTNKITQRINFFVDTKAPTLTCSSQKEIQNNANLNQFAQCNADTGSACAPYKCSYRLQGQDNFQSIGCDPTERSLAYEVLPIGNLDIRIEATDQITDPQLLHSASVTCPATVTTAPLKILFARTQFIDRKLSPTFSADYISDIWFGPSSTALAKYFNKISFGNLNIVGDVVEVDVPIDTRLPDPYTGQIAGCRLSQISLMTTSALTGNGIDLSKYDKLAFISPALDGCGAYYGALGGRDMWLFDYPMNPILITSMAHEFGHTLGLDHVGAPFSKDPIWSYVYIPKYIDWDRSEIMGTPDGRFNYLNAQHMVSTGWIPSDQVPIVSKSGTYDLSCLEVNPKIATLPQILKIPRNNKNDFYYVSYRCPIDFDSTLPSVYFEGVTISADHNGFFYDDGTSEKEPANASKQIGILKDLDSMKDPLHQIQIQQLSHDATSVKIQIGLGADFVPHKESKITPSKTSCQVQTSTDWCNIDFTWSSGDYPTACLYKTYFGSTPQLAKCGPSGTITLPVGATKSTFFELRLTDNYTSRLIARIEVSAEVMQNPNALFQGTLVSKNSSKCLAHEMVEGMPTTNLIQMDCNRSSSQYWFIEKVPNSDKISIRSRMTGYCVTSPPNANGAIIYTAPCDGSLSQSWRYVPEANNLYSFRRNSDYTLDVVGYSKDDGAKINLYTYTGNFNQLWSLVP